MGEGGVGVDKEVCRGGFNHSSPHARASFSEVENQNSNNKTNQQCSWMLKSAETGNGFSFFSSEVIRHSFAPSTEV